MWNIGNKTDLSWTSGFVITDWNSGSLCWIYLICNLLIYNLRIIFSLQEILTNIKWENVLKLSSLHMYVKYNSSGRNKPKYKYMQCENVLKFNLSIKKSLIVNFFLPQLNHLALQGFWMATCKNVAWFLERVSMVISQSLIVPGMPLTCVNSVLCCTCKLKC